MKKQSDIYKTMAEKYYEVLNWLYGLNDKDIENGLHEGMNKFLSNLYLSFFNKNKLFACEYISEKALKLVKSNKKQSLKGTIFEHMVPKSAYIQKVSEEKAKKGILKQKNVEQLLKKYFHCALITADEDKKLMKNKMPDDWDKNDVFARYYIASISLIKNPYFGKKSEK